MRSESIARRPVIEVVDDRSLAREDSLIAEAPVEVRFNGEPFAVMMATPSSLDDLVRGFAITEGLIESVADISSIDISSVLEGFIADVTAVVADDMSARLLPSRSGCGLCGARTLEDAVHQWPQVPSSTAFIVDAISSSLAALRANQEVNSETGSSHAAAWVSRSGKILLVREDVGRHNALDKLLGALLASDFDSQAGFVVVTSRASYEMVSKVIRCGIGLLVAISAPTALAVDIAASGNLCLVAFARDGRFNIYAHAERVTQV